MGTLLEIRVKPKYFAAPGSHKNNVRLIYAVELFLITLILSVKTYMVNILGSTPQAEADMRCKMELIQQIRAMEATPVSRFKQVDLASTAGAGLLGEMSILEVSLIWWGGMFKSD